MGNIFSPKVEPGGLIPQTDIVFRIAGRGSGDCPGSGCSSALRFAVRMWFNAKKLSKFRAQYKFRILQTKMAVPDYNLGVGRSHLRFWPKFKSFSGRGSAFEPPLIICGTVRKWDMGNRAVQQPPVVKTKTRGSCPYSSAN